MKTRSDGLRKRMAKASVKRRKHRQIFSNAFLKLLRRTCRLLATLAGIPAAGLITAAFYFSSVLPDTYYLEDPTTFALSQYRILEPVSQQENTVQTLVSSTNAESESEKMQGSITGKDTGQTIEYTLMLGGIIPVKTVTAVESEARYVIPSGSVFGLKMLTDGAVVASLSPVETASGTVCPAELAGIQSGDIILTANGQQINSFDTLSSVISAAGENGQPVQITYSRDNTEKQTSLSPVQTTDGQWLAGMWVRDSSAGIGTITWYDPASGLFTGLGHPVCDVDTGELMPLNRGEAVEVSVTGVSKGQSGTPGELKGCFLEQHILGPLTANTDTGIYGQLRGGSQVLDTAPVPVATKQEVHTGAATILTTLDGSTPKEYDVEIEQVDLSGDSATKNLVVRITDPELIEAAGGIVQGMSGSPILQDGMIVGSVTHVFVNDPLRGFGIFAENILMGAAASLYSTGDAA